MKYIWKNWCQFIREHFPLFMILVVSQISSVVCILLVYGVFQSNLYEREGDEDNNRLLEAKFEDGISSGDVTELIRSALEDWEFSIEYVAVEAESETGKEIFEDFMTFHEGRLQYDESMEEPYGVRGRLPREEEYRNAEKVALVPHKKINKKTAVGTTIDICGESYTIIGSCDDEGEELYRIPYTALPEKSHVTRVSMHLEDLVSRPQYTTFCDWVKHVGGETFEFYIPDQADVKRSGNMMFVCVVLAILSAGNNVIVYAYLFRRRKKQMIVYTVCGCSKRQARAMFMGEIVWNLLLTTAVGTALFGFVVYPYAGKIFPYLSYVYSVKRMGVLLAVYVLAACLLGETVAIRFSGKTIQELRTE